jgi:hypothetical protein
LPAFQNFTADRMHLVTPPNSNGWNIPLNIWQFLSSHQQEVSADIIQNSAVGNFSQKTEGTKTKASRCLCFLMCFPILYI